MTPIISLVALKASLLGLVPVETPEPHSLYKPSCPLASIPTDALIWASSDWGPPKAPSPGSLTGKEGFYWPCGWQPAFKPPTSSSVGLLNLNNVQRKELKPLSVITALLGVGQKGVAVVRTKALEDWSTPCQKVPMCYISNI